MPENDKPAEKATTLGLLLTEGFALMSYASTIEPYRAANILAGQSLYRWVHISPNGQPVSASNGATFLPDQAVGDDLACDALFVFAAGDPARFADDATFAWLRRMAARGTTLVGVSGGPFLLARAGLLDGYRATIHWEHQAAFSEAFPTITLEAGLYVFDRRRVTCAGGTAGLDLAIELIERQQGHALARKVSDWFIRTESRPADKPQRLSLRDRYGVGDDRLLRVLARMEASIEEPLSRQMLAETAGVSLRQLERLFAHHLGQKPHECYMRIRLDQAKRLLATTGMSVTDVGLACGFRSSSHFSHAFKARFGEAPTDAARGKRLRQRVRPRPSPRTEP